MEVDETPLTDEQAEALLKKLAKHYREPVSPVSRYCNALRTWATLIEEGNLPGRRTAYLPEGEEEVQMLEDYRHPYAEQLNVILRDISKSNLLARLIYEGAPLRTIPCPRHKGKWSGISECPYGCGETGWLPTESERASMKGRLNDVIEKLHKNTAASTQAAPWWVKSLATYEAMRSYLYPDVPGTGIEAPKDVKHTLVIYPKAWAYHGKRGFDFYARFDIDPALRTGRKDGHETEVPEAELRSCLDFFTRLAASFDEYNPLWKWESMVRPYEKLYPEEAGRHGVSLGAFVVTEYPVGPQSTEEALDMMLGSILSYAKAHTIPGVRIVCCNPRKG